MYFDRQGEEMVMEQWAQLHEDMAYKRVAEDDIGPYWVSTVWIGLDMSFTGEGPPIIFETMVFLRDQRDDPEHFGLADIDCSRYSTEEEALAGHEATCLLVRATLQEEPPSEVKKPRK